MTTMSATRGGVYSLATAIGLALASPATAQTPAYDLLLRNARIVDGSGKPAYRGDLAITGDTIASIASKIDGGAKRVIDIGGQVLAPGFIDVHNHARTRRGIFQHPTADNFGKYPPAKPGALLTEPLKAAGRSR
jgi:hypothetical protein